MVLCLIEPCKTGQKRAKPRKTAQNRTQSDENRHIATAEHMGGRLGVRRCGIKLPKSLEEGICPPTRQGDGVRPATGGLYHRRVAMSTKKWRQLLGGGDVTVQSQLLDFDGGGGR